MLKKLLKTGISMLFLSWFLFGWPVIWPIGRFGINTIRIPPKIREVQAAVTYFGSASTPADNSTNTASPTAVTPPANMVAGDLVLLFAFGSGTTDPVISQAGGQSWTALPVRTASSRDGRTFWAQYNGTWSANPSVTMPGTSNNIVVMHVFRPTVGTNTWAVDVTEVAATYTAPASPFTVTRAGITTLTNGALAIAIWTSADDNTWGSLSGAGWNVLGAAQYRNTSGSNDGSQSFAYQVTATAGPTGNVSKNQAALGGDAGGTAIIAFKEVAQTTTLGDGTDPGNSTVAPASTDNYVDQFSLLTSSGSDSVTALTVTTANTSAVANVQIWNEAMTTQYFSTVSSPTGNDWSFSGGTAIPVSASSTPFRVIFTAKDHSLGAGTYAVTGTVTDYTCTNTKAGTDTDSATITVDNTSPANVTSASGSSGIEQVSLNWTNPGDSDFHSSVVLRKTDSAVGDIPTEGTTYPVGEFIGSSTVACVVATPTASCIDTGLTGATAYYYKIFTKDTHGNYSASGVEPTGSPFTPTAKVISVTITTDGTISYGILNFGGQKSTIDVSDTQTAKNDGNIAEDFTITTSNAAGGTGWTLGSSSGINVFVHEFSTTGGSSWIKFTTADSYQSFVTNVAANTTQNFDLRVTTPSSSDAVSKTITVTILATQH